MGDIIEERDIKRRMRGWGEVVLLVCLEKIAFWFAASRAKPSPADSSGSVTAAPFRNDPRLP